MVNAARIDYIWPVRMSAGQQHWMEMQVDIAATKTTAADEEMWRAGTEQREAGYKSIGERLTLIRVPFGLPSSKESQHSHQLAPAIPLIPF